MTPKAFHEKFREFLREVYSDQPIPVSQMIVEFQVAGAKCCQWQIQSELEEATRNIVPTIIPSSPLNEDKP